MKKQRFNLVSVLIVVCWYALPSAACAGPTATFGNGVTVEKVGNNVVIIDSGGRHIINRTEFAGKPLPVAVPRDCAGLKHWLDTHSPTARGAAGRQWRYFSLVWAEDCL
jgi:hypothetical protein